MEEDKVDGNEAGAKSIAGLRGDGDGEAAKSMDGVSKGTTEGSLTKTGGQVSTASDAISLYVSWPYPLTRYSFL